MSEHKEHDFVSVMRGAGVDILECRHCDARRLELAAGFGVPNVQIFTNLVRAAQPRAGAPADEPAGAGRRSSWWRWPLLRRWV